jgi:hypothetical protein
MLHGGSAITYDTYILSYLTCCIYCVLNHRIQLFNSLRKFQDVLNLDILLKGSPILNVEENTEIFDADTNSDTLIWHSDTQQLGF